MLIPIALTFIALVTLGYVFAFVGRRSRHMPDGPPTLPVIGNLHQLPMTRGYLKFAEWAKQYGGMYSVKIASQNTIVITDRRLVKELMDKRGLISSNRPPAIVLDSMIYEGAQILTMNHTNPRLRAARKVIHQHFMGTMVEDKHMSVINAEAVQLLRDLCVAPEEFLEHLKRLSNSIIMSIGYGFRTPTVDTPHFVKIHQVLANSSKLLEPGHLPPVDLFPILRWVPERFFGNWMSKVKTVHFEMHDLHSQNLAIVEQRRAQEGPRETFADRLIDQQKEFGWDRKQVYFLAGSIVEAGSDTTSHAMGAFVQMMAIYPEVAKKAQKEIDALIGEDRTPIWDDFAKLPIVTAIIKETMRIRPIVPIAFPHALAEEVWLDGKLLPKNSTIIVNVFGLHHDANKFANPSTFDLSHYDGKTALASDYANLADYEARDHYGYGVGRRLCPGIHFAERTLFVAIAKMLWAFNISPGRDEKGNVVKLDMDSVTGYSDGIVVGPNPFPCEIIPRSEKRRETIMREFAQAERDVFSKYKVPKE